LFDEKRFEAVQKCDAFRLGTVHHAQRSPLQGRRYKNGATWKPRLRNQMLLWCIAAGLLSVIVTPRVQCWTVDDVTVTEDDYGVLGNQTVKRFTFSNRNMMVQIITYGARISAIKVPDSHGGTQDVVLGFDNLEGT
jgi:hypothetical protein